MSIKNCIFKSENIFNCFEKLWNVFNIEINLLLLKYLLFQKKKKYYRKKSACQKNKWINKKVLNEHLIFQKNIPRFTKKITFAVFINFLLIKNLINFN